MAAGGTARSEVIFAASLFLSPRLMELGRGRGKRLAGIRAIFARDFFFRIRLLHGLHFENRWALGWSGFGPFSRKTSPFHRRHALGFLTDFMRSFAPFSSPK